jgi:hypothetical protein
MITVVWSGIDTLETSYRGSLAAPLAAALDELKARAQEVENPQPLTLGSTDFAVQERGMRPWAYLLKGDEMHLRLGAKQKYPAASFRLLAMGLAAHGHEALFDTAHRLAMGCGDLGEPGLSRLDRTVDFQGWTPTTPEMDNVVCAATFRPIYPSWKKPETFQFGKGQIVVRLYNKTRELAASDKQWLRELWKLAPGYNPELDVWRFEVQYRRKALCELGMDMPAHAFANLDRLLGFGLDWCNLRIPRGKSSDRWLEDERWTALRDAAHAEGSLSRVRVEARVGTVEQLVPMITGASLSAAARLGVYELPLLWQILEPLVRQYAERDGSSFRELAKDRASKLLG